MDTQSSIITLAVAIITGLGSGMVGSFITLLASERSERRKFLETQLQLLYGALARIIMPALVASERFEKIKAAIREVEDLEDNRRSDDYDASLALLHEYDKEGYLPFRNLREILTSNWHLLDPQDMQMALNVLEVCMFIDKELDKEKGGIRGLWSVHKACRPSKAISDFYSYFSRRFQEKHKQWLRLNGVSCYSNHSCCTDC